MRARNKGFTLVELMVAVVLTLVTAIVVMQVLSVYESRKRTATVGNDASMSAAVGMYLLEREVRMSGAGLTTPSGFACNAGVNLYYGAATVADGVALAPLSVVDGGGAAPDRIQVMYSDSAFGVAPTTIVQGMAAPDSVVVAHGNIGLAAGDLALLGSADGSKICTFVQLSAAPAATGSSWQLSHGRTSAAAGMCPPSATTTCQYNPTNPAAAFTTAMRYDVGDIVVNLGRLGVRTFRVVCNDSATAVPGPTNSCDLVSYNPLASAADPVLANVASIASQVVNLQVQYGVAPASSQTVNEWVDATGGWAAPSAADQRRIKAVRLAIVTRGNWEKDILPDAPTTPATLTVLPAVGATAAVEMALSDDERHYRYKVLRTVIPLINVIWAGV